MMTLPKDNRGTVFYVKARSLGPPETIWLTWMCTIVNGAGYAIRVSIYDKIYTPTVRQTVDTILKSVTVKSTAP
jgi:hypothetical protein